MPEAPVQAPPAPPPSAPAKSLMQFEPRKYTLRFEPDKEFSETTLFIKGTVRGTVWISDQTSIVMRSLIAEDVDKINEAVKIKEGMSMGAYQSEITYWNLALSVEKVGDKTLDGTIDEKIKKIRGMATSVLTRMALAYLEFNVHVDDLFRGKEALDLAKKS